MAATPSASERTSRHLDVLVERDAADVHNHGRAARSRSSGSRSRDEAVHADALQADGVEHSGRRFDDARRRMAFALGEEEAFHRDRAERGTNRRRRAYSTP